MNKVEVFGLTRPGQIYDLTDEELPDFIAELQRRDTDFYEILTPKPGDVVILTGKYSFVEYGSRAVIDTHYFSDDEAMICFAASAYRSDKPRLGIVEMIELNMTNDGPITLPYVSCSGGPLPFVKTAELEYVGRTMQAFWRWKDRPRAGGGEHFMEEVNLWSWKGRP